MDGKQVEKSFDEAMLILYENSLSSEAKASVKHALDNEKGLEAEGWLEPKATKPPTPKNN